MNVDMLKLVSISVESKWTKNSEKVSDISPKAQEKAWL